MRKILNAFLLLFVAATTMFASRREMLLNDNWNFRFSWQVQKNSERRVDIPHTWNAQDALSGKQDYYRGVGIYRKQLPVPADWQGKRLYLRFEGVNTVANLFVNQKHVGEHRGGYGAFVFDITDYLTFGQENELLVRVNNALQLDIMPLVGDFNFYGGIYRDVRLIVTEPQHISLTDYASSGVYLIQESVSKEQATVKTRVMLTNRGTTTNGEIHFALFDGTKQVETKMMSLDMYIGENQLAEFDFTLKGPHLWNGKKDPFCYRAVVSLYVDGKEVDRVEQPLGLRFYTVDPDKGFYLNGELLKLKGVCRHQDRPEIGNALRPVHHEEDMAIMLDMGVNAVRLSHYPQAAYVYDLADRNGLILWSEIPFIGPGGYEDRGYVNQPSFRASGREQLKEMIRQQYNHPSILFWGLYNELKTLGDNPEAYIVELNKLAELEDPTRLTVAASFLEDANPLSPITDLIAWNKYYGWYGGKFSDLGVWADGIHQKFPAFKLGVSEYGAGASIYHQQEEVKAGAAAGWWHPENWQTAYHIDNWKAIAERPFIWGSFVWNMFDFGAAHRTEGDRPGINDKGLVTFNRKVKKDAYYFYKANWNKEEGFVYIANRRCTQRTQAVTDIQIFSNRPEVELFVNGKSLGKKHTDAYAICQWEDVQLSEGENRIEACYSYQREKGNDTVVWFL